MMNESNFTQVITLPSKGLLNPEIPKGEVTQRCMMVSDQKFLNGSSHNSGSLLNQLIQRTTTAPEGFDISNLTPTDTIYMLFKLRVLSYGDMYTFRTRCPECGKKIDVTVNLAELPVETLEDDFTEKLSVELPRRGDTVYTKIMTNADKDALTAELSRRKRKNPQDESEYILKIVYAIEKIKLKKDGSELTHPIDIERYVSSLTDYDAQVILATKDSVSFGLGAIVECTCSECKQDIEVGLNFSGDFFRPSIVR